MPVHDDEPSELITVPTSDAGRPTNAALQGQLDDLLALHREKCTAVVQAVQDEDGAVKAVMNLSEMVNGLVSTLSPLVGKLGSAPSVGSAPHSGLLGALGTISSTLGSLASIHTSLKSFLPGIP